jgi:hypothetical protein
MTLKQTENETSSAYQPILTTVSYGKALRVIGQELAGMFPRVLEITADGANFAVSGECHPNPFEAVKESFFKKIWQSLFARASAADSAQTPAPATSFSRSYDGAEIARLDQISRARRSGNGRRADAYSLAERLRTLGSIVDTNKGRLKHLRKEADRFSVEYWDPQGEVKTAKLTTVIMYRNQLRIDARRQDSPAELWEGYDF